MCKPQKSLRNYIPDHRKPAADRRGRLCGSGEGEKGRKEKGAGSAGEVGDDSGTG